MNPSDEAVEAAAQTLRNEGGEPGHNIHGWRCEHPDRYGECDCVTVTARAMLEAAYQVDGVRPVLDRAEVDAALIANADSLTRQGDAVMELVRPLPTGEQIAEALQDHYPTAGATVASGVTCQCGYWNGVESPGRDRPVGAQGRDGLNWHRAQVGSAHVHSDELAPMNGETDE